jgi:AcrR family transcriptional regulator
MPRRARSDGDRTRELILEAAAPLFAREGYAGASIRAIAAAADVNVATLAYHFADKDGLYLAVCQRLHEELSVAFPAVVIGPDAAETIRGVVAQAFTFVRAHRLHHLLLLRNVLDEGRHRDELLDRWVDPLMGRADTLVCAFRPEWAPARRRLLVLTVMHTLVRVVLEDPAQHARMLGVDEETAERETQSWFADFVCRELGLNPPVG